MIVVDVPIRVVSEANRHEHWRWKAKRAKAQRHAVALAWWEARPVVVLPAVVTLVRVAPRELDDDNLRGALKAVRDEVADALGLPNDRDPRVRWEYGQRRGRVKEYGVVIAVVPMRHQGDSDLLAPGKPSDVKRAAHTDPGASRGG